MLRHAHFYIKGGKPPFAALCANGNNTQEVEFAKFSAFLESGPSREVRQNDVQSNQTGRSEMLRC
jgi:hypothetical protein